MFFQNNIRWIILGLAVVMYLFIILFQNKKVWFSSIVALIVLILGMIFPGAIFKVEGMEGAMASPVYAFTQAVNWNVLLIYLGSMIIASLFIYSKVPARIADKIIEVSPGTGLAMVLILCMTGIISIFVENVATVLVMAPIALALCKKIKCNPTLFMIGLAVMSNLEGTATLVGDPPSMIFASYAGYNFNDFFIHEGRLSVFFIVQSGLIAGCIFFYFFFAKNNKNKIQAEKTPVVSYFPFILLLLMIFGLAGISFIPVEINFLSGGYVFFLGICGIIWYLVNQKKSKKETWNLIKELDWETIFFLIGIFIVIAAIQAVGLLEDFAHFLAGLTNGSELLGFTIILFVSIIISGFIDNVPYIIAMLPVADSMALTMGVNRSLFMFALLIGSCLGGNLTPYGASANVVSMGILKKEGYPIKFSGWLKIGVPFTFLTTGISALVLWLLWA